MMNAKDRFGAIGIVVDWIDACKQRRLDVLLDLYDEEATVEVVKAATSPADPNWSDIGSRGSPEPGAMHSRSTP